MRMSKMARTTKLLEPTFEKTCDLIYRLASFRISQKYNKWKKDQSYSSSMIEFYPSDRKLFGYVLKPERKKDNPYLLTPKLVEVLLEKLDFIDKNEVYWGQEDEVSSYLEDLFTTILIEMKTYNEYTKYWMETPLTTEREIKDFYLKFILGNADVFESLKDDFINFTYNSYEYFELLDEVGEIIKDSVAKKDSNEALTFHELPKKIKIYADNILLPFVSGICLENLIDSFGEAPTE